MENKDKNCFGHPMVDLGKVPFHIIRDVENPSKKVTTLGDLEVINKLRITSPNGKKIYWGRGLVDSFFEGKSRTEEVKIEHRMITNSSVFHLTEDVGFTEELLNDQIEMEKYMGWVVRLRTSYGNFIDCPLDYYSSIFMKEEITMDLSPF